MTQLSNTGRLNLRGGWTLVRKNLFSFTASRGFFWTLAVGWMMAPLLLYLLVWLAAAAKAA
jgi:ABC-2 type transport system permease protein